MVTPRRVTLNAQDRLARLSIQNRQPVDLAKITTKQLMAWREKCYKMEGKMYDPYNQGKGPRFVYLEEVIAVLDTREHVPNKQEARKIRQQKAKSKS